MTSKRLFRPRPKSRILGTPGIAHPLNVRARSKNARSFRERSCLRGSGSMPCKNLLLTWAIFFLINWSFSLYSERDRIDMFQTRSPPVP